MRLSSLLETFLSQSAVYKICEKCDQLHISYLYSFDDVEVWLRCSFGVHAM